MLEEVEIGGNIMPKLIKKEATTLQLYFANPCKHGNACNSAMATCVMPLLKGGIMGSSRHCTNQQPSLSLIEKGGLFFLKGHRMGAIWTK